MVDSTANNALFINATTSLISTINTRFPVYDSHNWEFRPGMLSAIMEYAEQQELKYVFLYCNLPSLTMKAVDHRKFSILLSEVTSCLVREVALQPTQKNHPTIISFFAPMNSGWQFPNSKFFEYVTNTYVLDKSLCTLIGDSTMDKKCAEMNDIPTCYSTEIFTNLNTLGHFAQRN